MIHTANTTTAEHRVAAVQSRRLRRAREIIFTRELWGRLTYMENCPLGDRDGGVNPGTMRRYMVVTSTDGSGDGWTDFMDTMSEVEKLAQGLLNDEWGLVGVWDLDHVTIEPLLVGVQVQVTYPRSRTSHD